jgi:hypothetical protein
VIDQVAPDLAAVQQIGPTPALARLQERLTHQLPHAAIGDADDRQIRMAILSAHPLADITPVRAFPSGMRAVQSKDEISTTPPLLWMRR